ncbi:DUF2157 domain-containing protein [Megasphaera paucivorans]|uniref:Predicted membrane protein n=1 Tax=Megasphaera paucivorans TaxID=349095 RepID=A0A1G9WQN9_9FIRM|nr:DUF2157 domain-containing protein [Megasphaera paucivorans]SDM86719.1 Predicted membrane protein [Megasphaera paucivorans]
MAADNKKNKFEIADTQGRIRFFSLYMLLAVIGISVAGIAGIWGAAFTWYHIPIWAKMTIALVILFISQVGVGMAMFQERQGTWIGEGVALVHCAAVFISVTLLETTFYTGSSSYFYMWVCAVLILPGAYLLRSAASIIAYAGVVLYWAFMTGVSYSPGGCVMMWILLALAGPFYMLLRDHHDEVRLAIFSWAGTIAVFLAFGIAAGEAPYIPFLLFSALAGVVLLMGYAIDSRKAWGVPFRWLGRLAAVGALLVSCLPAAWDSVIRVAGFQWMNIAVTVLLLFFGAAIYGKALKRKLWSPALYALIPLLIGAETVLIRNGIAFSVPIFVSSIYIFFLGMFEVFQGVRFGKAHHLRWGLTIFIFIGAAVLMGSHVSPFAMVISFIVICAAGWQLQRFFRKKKVSFFQQARQKRHAKKDHTVTSVRQGINKKRRNHPVDSPYKSNAADITEQQEALPGWMTDAVNRESAALPHTETVSPKEPAVSTFVAPVFHGPDQIPLPDKKIFAEIKKEAKENKMKQTKKRSESVKTKPVTTSPWGTPASVKRKKQFTQSPWSKEGESKK